MLLPGGLWMGTAHTAARKERSHTACCARLAHLMTHCGTTHTSGAHFVAHGILTIEGNVWERGGPPNLSTSVFSPSKPPPPSSGTRLVCPTPGSTLKAPNSLWIGRQPTYRTIPVLCRLLLRDFKGQYDVGIAAKIANLQLVNRNVWVNFPDFGRNVALVSERLQPWQCPYAAQPPPPPLCDIPSGCCFFTGPWTVTRSSLRMLRRGAAFCRPLRPVLLLVSFPRSRSPVVGAPPPPPGCQWESCVKC